MRQKILWGMWLKAGLGLIALVLMVGPYLWFLLFGKPYVRAAVDWGETFISPYAMMGGIIALIVLGYVVAFRR